MVKTDNQTRIGSKRQCYIYIKRITDIFISCMALILICPFLLFISVIIKLEDPKSNVIFHQYRVGEAGKIFKMYKFRSMYPDAESRLHKLKHLNEIEGKMFKMKDDPRVTKIGKFIRAYSIDELPQLINVIKGDMSLIGPRPPLITEYEKYTEFEKKRLEIRPGLSGLWQVSGRNSLSFDEMVDLDLKYIKKLSLKNDIIILFKTVVVVLKKDNAY